MSLPLPTAAQLRKSESRELWAVIPILEWTIANQPQRAEAHLQLVRAELKRRGEPAPELT